jgi:hypothetical protein
MKVRSFLVVIIFTLTGLLGNSLAFEIQYPGEEGFYVGKPMIYRITADSSGGNVGAEGTFVFGQDRTTIDGIDYYDCVFESPVDLSHFYLRPDSVKKVLFQKGFVVGVSELELDSEVKGVVYPLSPGSNWSDNTNLTAKNLEVPGFGVLTIPISIKDIKVETEVTSEVLSVPAGTFDTLRVEANFAGSLLGIPVNLIQYTWLSEDNVPVKRNFEFGGTVIYEIELSKLSPTPWDVDLDGSTDMSDILLVARNFGKQIEKVRVPNPDVNGDGIVNILDLAQVGAHFGE